MVLSSNNIFFHQLSPKKTLEGYIGGGILTVIIGTASDVFRKRTALDKPSASPGVSRVYLPPVRYSPC